MPSQAEIRQQITEQVVAALRAGTRPWIRPWASLENAGHPANVVSGRRYSGVNVLALLLASQARHYQSKFWGTYRQWESLGFQV
jgi:antirestriction protein ArdC